MHECTQDPRTKKDFQIICSAPAFWGNFPRRELSPGEFQADDEEFAEEVDVRILDDAGAWVSGASLATFKYTPSRTLVLLNYEKSGVAASKIPFYGYLPSDNPFNYKFKIGWKGFASALRHPFDSLFLCFACRRRAL